ncbi:hypothetical protein AYI70_g9104 [Smittium culicis]|uniref:BHLH domain-containing protein n=1 Tax=Smittium culicis TaxID=133412 RepID=A0A1R1XCV6_9FUNG|nr:hypothetical protein AYI70_g9104 [Smittium culicis]
MNQEFTPLDSSNFYSLQNSDDFNNQFIQHLNSNQNSQAINIRSNPLQRQLLEDSKNALSPMFINDFNNSTNLSESSFSPANNDNSKNLNDIIQQNNNSNFLFYNSLPSNTNSALQGIPISNPKFKQFDRTPLAQADSPYSIDNDNSAILSSVKINHNNSNYKNGISHKLDMFPSLFDDAADLSPSNSLNNNNNINSVFGSYNSSNNNNNLLNFNNNRVSELRNMATSPPTDTSDLYSTSLPIMNNWQRNLNFQHLNDLQPVLENNSFSNSPGFPQSSQAAFSPDSPFSTSFDLREPELDVKKRRRRESHNAVERRRRDYINEQIQELYNLLPDSMRDQSIKPNKGLILRKSVAYIKELKNKIPNENLNHNPNDNLQNYPNMSSGLSAMLGGSAYNGQSGKGPNGIRIPSSQISQSFQNNNNVPQ